MTIATPRGTRDYGPSETIFLKSLIATTEDIFKRFGFYPIETPSIENMETLSAKAYGEESTKELYVIEGGEEGLRYDFTVPLARYVSMNKDIRLPFKRYYIGNAWRKDEPQRLRYREFMQADVDIIGSNEPISDAEVIATAAMAIEKLGLVQYVIRINSRILLDALLAFFKIPGEKHQKAIRSIDKLDKIGVSGVIEEMKSNEIDQQNSEKIINFILEKSSNAEILSKLNTNIPDTKPELDRINKILDLLSVYNLNGTIQLDLSLARGLDYYTSTVCEFVAYEGEKRLPSLGGGGRYDNLIGIYSKKETPAVGMSLGIGRIFNLLYQSDKQKTYADVYVTYINEENMKYAMTVANRIRASGVYVDFEVTKRNLSKQLEHSSSLGVTYTIIIGKQEMEQNMVKIRNMYSGEERMATVEEALSIIKGE
jgi:histidyl-tRNA synthetase